MTTTKKEFNWAEDWAGPLNAIRAETDVGKLRRLVHDCLTKSETISLHDVAEALERTTGVEFQQIESASDVALKEIKEIHYYVEIAKMEIHDPAIVLQQLEYIRERVEVAAAALRGVQAATTT